MDEQTHRQIYARCSPEKGDVLYIKDGATTGLAINNPLHEQFSMLSSVALLKPNRTVLDEVYLKHWLNAPDTLSSMIGQMAGSAIRRLTLTTIASQSICLPPISEQRRIAAKLDHLTAGTARARVDLDRLPILVAHYKQALLAAAFSGELTREWRAAEKISTPAEAILLSDVASSFSYGSSAKSRASGQVPVLRMGNIQDGRLDWNNLAYTSDAAEIDKYRLSPGDVLFNRTNSPELVEKTALFDIDRPAIYAGYLIRVRCSERLLPSYLVNCLNSPAGRGYCWRVKTDGVSQSNINAKKLAAFVFPLPSLPEQHEINRRIAIGLGWLGRLSAEHARAAHLLRKLDRATLAKAFRGELVPQDPTDESAAVLLNRVRAARTAAPKPKRGHQPRETRSITMANPREQLEKQLETWPDRGLSFEQVAARVSGDYEAIREAVFALLAGPTPALKQQFDEKDRIMRIRKATQ